MSMKDACLEIIENIKKGKIETQQQLENEKIVVAKKFLLNKVPKNAEIFAFVDNNDSDYEKIKKFLQIKPIRTLSGVANIAVMWLGKNKNGIPFSCPGKCIYCPRGKNAPQSYTGTEPTTMRAMRNLFDPYNQVKNRLNQLHIIGHPTDKCELIIMGGTFPAISFSEQKSFIKNCFDALNGRKSKSLKDAQKINEKSKNRCVGLTIETRPDYCNKKIINQMLELGATRVEIGVQTLDEKLLKKIKRGHTTKDVKKAIKLAKDAGLKVCIHLMPGLTGLNKLDIKKELYNFKEIFRNEDYRPDELKIYPTLVVPGTKIHELWLDGKYKPLTIKQTIDLLIKIKKIVPEYVRIKRVMRDISSHEVVAGPAITNLRQLVIEKMKNQGLKCRCIRCREIRSNKIKNPKLKIIEYKASRAKEFFLSYEDDDHLIGFLRLRLLKNKALVRELHVYGPMIEIGKKGDVQHSGFGKLLLNEAEKIAINNKCNIIQITSGTGVRDYYSKMKYKLVGYYMIKKLYTKN